MAALIPVIAGLGSSALGALGSSGKQGQTKSEQQSSSTQTTDMTQTPNEQPYFADFRKGLIPQFDSMMRKAQQPIYGDAQKAGVISDANNIFNTGMQGLRGAMAAGGRLRSGAMESAGMGMGINRAGGIASFFSQLPAMEQQAQWAKAAPLLQAGMGWAGQAPVGQTTKGTQQMTGNASGTQTQYGPSFGQNMAYGMGGMLPNILGGLFPDAKWGN
jgi:hypothetical protein